MGVKFAAAGVAAGLLVAGMVAGDRWLVRRAADVPAGSERAAGAAFGRWVTPPAPRARGRATPAPRAAAVRPAGVVPLRLGPYSIRRATGDASVALTFDDGPDPRWTPAVLDLLREHRASATFCVVGVNAEAFPDLVRRIVTEGHTLCNHSWRHEISLGTWSAGAIRANLTRVNDAIRRAVPGAVVPYFRHPGGAWTARAAQVAADLGMASIHWDVDPQDWRRPGAGAITRVVSAETRPGSIVLLHDGGGDRSGTVAACRSFLPDLRDRFALLALPAPPPHGLPRGRYQVPD